MSCFGGHSLAFAESTRSVWDVLRVELTLNHELNQPEVQTQLRWLISHPSYLNQLARAEPYIYHILTEIKKRKLPGEIALIPMIESSFDPFAYSGAGAAGLWQLMPGTGTDLGLKQDWWFDARRSIGPSTDAALNYLAYLHKFFNGDWILAFAAYDSGEGTMARIIKNSGQTGKKINFWSLRVPQETKAYIPRLLALAEVIQNPKRYHVQLPNIPHLPYFEEVNIGSQIDLNNAAKLAGISYQDLIKLNPGYNRWATAPYRPYKLLIPADKVEDFSRNLANLPEEDRVSWTRHQVSAGDNLSIIAHQYHTTINLIKELNQLKSNEVKKGQFVLIPSKKPLSSSKKILSSRNKKPTQHFTPVKQYKTIHIVQKNDTIASLEKTYHVQGTEIRQWNHLPMHASLKPGQSLTLWRESAPSSHRVQRGDTLSGIAQIYHIPLNRLIALNPALKHRPLKPGMLIKLA
ncbi:MAG: LysM peptidoglycan-binding domain-containing protein [Legionellaceae bacterium]